MSIVTRTGDKGTTGLMYGRRVMKSDRRIEACGAVDELNSALGVARAAAQLEWIGAVVRPIQKELVSLMGELAVPAEDLRRYVSDGYPVVTPAMTAELEKGIEELEKQGISSSGWATPGDNPSAAALDLARSICRRAERRVCRLQESDDVKNPEILIYLNRLSDLLWLMARGAEAGLRTK